MPAPKRRLLAVILGLALVAFLLPYLRPRPVPRYTVTDLGVLPGDTVSSASGINNKGEIVGFSGDGDRIFLYVQGRMTVVKLTKGFHGKPIINESGQINYYQRVGSTAVVSGYEKSLPHHTILYSGRRKMEFTLPPGWRTAALRGVNGQGQVVGSGFRQVIGSSNRAASIRAAFVYDSKTKKFFLLPLPSGFQGGFPEDINDHEQIAGVAWRPGNSQAVLWNAGHAALLAGLPGMSENQGSGINNRGEVVGTASSELNAAAQFVNDHPQRWQLLVPFFQKQWQNRAVIFKGGKAQDLNTLIPDDADWDLKEANSINDNGQIVGEGLHHGQERAFLLTPVH